MSSVNVLVVFYSTYGHIYKLAQAVAEGASSVEGVTVRLARFPETLSDEILTKMHALEAKKQWEDVPEVTHDDFKWADAIVFGSPTRFGNVAGQVKSYIDSLGGLWASNALVGKLASAFTSSNTQHGGQETTIVCGFLPLFLHLGMLVVGLPYTFAGQFPVDEVSGGSPYGASVVAGVWGARQPSENELNAGRFQGKHVATQAVRLGKVPATEADKSN